MHTMAAIPSVHAYGNVTTLHDHGDNVYLHNSAMEPSNALPQGQFPFLDYQHCGSKV
jgi:uncharacterized Rossmann fold enzyme